MPWYHAGRNPHRVYARPGSGLDDVYAGKYKRAEDVEDTGLTVEFETDPDAATVHEAPEGGVDVDKVIADETPPDARKRKRDEK